MPNVPFRREDRKFYRLKYFIVGQPLNVYTMGFKYLEHKRHGLKRWVEDHEKEGANPQIEPNWIVDEHIIRTIYIK